jgi:hypothetical protein
MLSNEKLIEILKRYDVEFIDGYGEPVILENDTYITMTLDELLHTNHSASLNAELKLADFEDFEFSTNNADVSSDKNMINYLAA